jgi:hypothetical protein
MATDDTRRESRKYRYSLRDDREYSPSEYDEPGISIGVELPEVGFVSIAAVYYGCEEAKALGGQLEIAQHIVDALNAPVSETSTLFSPAFADMVANQQEPTEEMLRAANIVASEGSASDAIPIREILQQVDHIEQNGLSLAKFGGRDADEGRCRELCAMYLREFILTHEMGKRLQKIKAEDGK